MAIWCAPRNACDSRAYCLIHEDEPLPYSTKGDAVGIRKLIRCDPPDACSDGDACWAHTPDRADAELEIQEEAIEKEDEEIIKEDVASLSRTLLSGFALNALILKGVSLLDVADLSVDLADSVLLAMKAKDETR